MPRPKKPDALTPAERMARSRAGRKAVLLPTQAVSDLALVRARDGDPTDVAAIARLLREAASDTSK